MGEITWDHKRDVEKRVALWKDEDKKYAYVYFVSLLGYFIKCFLEKRLCRRVAEILSR